MQYFDGEISLDERYINNDCVLIVHVILVQGVLQQIWPPLVAF